MSFRRHDHITAVVIGSFFFFVGTLVALFGADVSTTRADFFEGNQDCSSPENGMCTYGYRCEDGKKGVIGKPCDDKGKVSGKKVTGTCVSPGVCKADEYDGKKVKQPEVPTPKLPTSELPKEDAPPQPIQKASFDPTSAAAENASPLPSESLLDKYGYTPQTLDNLQKMSEQGTNLKAMFENGDFKMEHAGVPLEYDNQGRLTAETYQQLQKALTDDVGSLQAPPTGSQYTDDSGKPALWQSAVQATGWAEKGSTAESSPESWWNKAIDYTESIYGKFFPTNDEIEVTIKSEGKNTGEFSNKRLTGYAPGPGDPMEGGFETSKRGLDGKFVPKTLDDFRLGKANYVTVATGDSGEYGKEFMFNATYKSPIDGKTYSLDGVKGVVHDWCPICRGTNKLDVATGDFQGWTGKAASNFVDRSFSGKVGGTVASQSFTVSLALNTNTLDWSAYQPLDLSYSFSPPQLAVDAIEYEVPRPLVYEPDYAAPEPVPQQPLYYSEPDLASEPPQEYYAAPSNPKGEEFSGQPPPDDIPKMTVRTRGVVSDPVPSYPDGNDFAGQPEPDAEHSQARQLVQGAVDWAKEQYQSLNDGFEALWQQEINQRMASDSHVPDIEEPLPEHVSHAQQVAADAAAAERQADRTKWQAAYEDLVNAYQDRLVIFRKMRSLQKTLSVPMTIPFVRATKTQHV